MPVLTPSQSGEDYEETDSIPNTDLTEDKDQHLEETSDETSSETIDEASGEASDEASDETFDETSNETFDKTSDESFDEASNEAFDEASDESFEDEEDLSDPNSPDEEFEGDDFEAWNEETEAAEEAGEELAEVSLREVVDESSEAPTFKTPSALLDGTPTDAEERERLREIINQKRDAHLGHQKFWGAMILVSTVLALLLWVLALYADNVSFTEGFFSGLILLGVAAFYAWRFKRELAGVHLLELDQRDKRKRLVEGNIQRKESTHRSDGVHYSFTLDGQHYELPREHFQEVRINEPLRLHLALHSGALLKVESLRKPKKKKKTSKKKKLHKKKSLRRKKTSKKKRAAKK